MYLTDITLSLSVFNLHFLNIKAGAINSKVGANFGGCK